MKKKFSKIVSAFLAGAMLLSTAPVGTFAAVASDLPDNMADSAILRALEYTGYDVQKQKNDGTLYQPGSFGSSAPASVLSDISYGLSLTGKETVSDSSTATGKAPDISAFEQYGLCCASFVTYYLCNYLPNIEGADTQYISDAVDATGAGTQSVSTWQTALNNLAAAGKIEKIGTSATDVDRSKLTPGDIIVFGTAENSHVHIAIYSGTYNGADFIIHVGNERGPEIMRADYMAQAGDKGSYPNAYFHLPENTTEPDGIIEVYKKGTGGEKLAGAVFMATNTETGLSYEIGPTNSSGYAKTSKPVPYGTYTVKETVFPTNYHAYDKTEWKVTVNADNNGLVTIEAINEIDEGSAKIVKTSEDGKISGITFTVTGNGVNKTVTTNAKGEILIENLKPGTYRVTEVTADKYKPQESRTVTVVSNKTATVTFNNELKRGDLKVIKTSEDNFVEGIKFHLYGTSLSGIAVDEYAVTDKNGVAYFNDILVSGETPYTIEEVDTSDRYIVPEKQTTPIEWNKVIEKPFDNELKRGDLKVIKTSEDNFVEGIKFHLYGTSLSGIKVDEYAVTEKNGVAYFNDILVSGKKPYTVEEVGAPDRYIVPEKQTTHIEWNKVIEKPFDNELKRGDLKVIKTSEDNFVEGIKFHLYGTSLSGIKVDEYAVTDKNGVAYFNDVLISGETPYTIEEVDTAIRYVVPENQTVPIKWEEVASRDMTNILKKFTVTVTKSDSEKGSAQGDATLEGAVYGIYKGEELIDTYTTDKYGQFTTQEYVCGDDWIIREITPSVGYLLDTAIYKVGAEAQLYTVEHNQTENDVNEQVVKGNIAIIKHTDDGETGIETPESGATFEVYLKSAGSYAASEEDERDIIVCDENGFGQTKDMPYGVYTVHQISGWEGRELMKDFDVFIAQDKQTYRYLINNGGFESYVRVVKTDAETGRNIAYAGAAFQIYDPDGKLVTMAFTYPTPTTVDTFYTDANGCLVTPKKLPYGKGYSIVEVKAPYGYVLDSTPVYFDVTQENSTEESGITVIKVNKPNTAQKGTITIEKTGSVFYGVGIIGGIDESKNVLPVVYQPQYEIIGLSGAVYEIRAAEDIITADGTIRFTKGEVVDTVTTRNNGFAKSRELYLGKYEIEEIKAPYGMVLNDEIHIAELVYAGENVSITETGASFINEKQKVEISLKKALEVNDLFGIGTNDEMKNISFGLFAAKELVSKSGTSIPADGLIEIITLDERGNGIFKTDLPIGSYYVKELATDKHYILSDTKYPITFEYVGQETAKVQLAVNDGEAIENELIYGSVSGKKIDENGEPLGGVLIGLFESNDTEFTTENALMTAISKENGSFSFEQIPFGVWYVREIEQPTGFVLNETVYEVNIAENEQVVEIEIVNDFVRGNITLTKVDAEYPDNKLFGAIFEVYKDNNADGQLDNSDTLIGTLTESEVGVYEMNELRYGHYLVKEVKAPEGFLLDEGVYPVFIETDGMTYAVENKAGVGFINAPIKGNITLTKVDAEYPDNKLSGAVFEVYKDNNADGQLDDGDTFIGTLTESELGIYEMNELRYGRYLVKEVEAPEGFLLDEGVYPVFIETDGMTYAVENKAGIGFINAPIKGNITLTKVDAEYPDNKLSGAVFEVYKDNNADGQLDDGDTFIGTLTESELGIYEMNELRYGRYLVKEVEAPEGFLLDEGVYPVFIETDGMTYAVENKAGIGFINAPIKGNITLTKVDAEYPDNKLSGAVFEVYKDNNADGQLDDGDTLFGTLSESEVGVYEMNELRYGHYLVKETKAPEGFMLDEGVYPVFIETDGMTYSVENKAGVGFVNETMRGNLKIVKTSDDGKVEGFSFRIVGDNGYDVILKTDKNGEITLSGLRIGEYTISEVHDDVSAPYTLPADKKATVMSDSTTIVEMHNSINDNPKTGENKTGGLLLPVMSCGVIGITAYTGRRKRKANR